MRTKEHINKRIKESKNKKAARERKCIDWYPQVEIKKKYEEDGFMGVEIKIEN